MMNMAVVSLIALAAAIVLGFVKKVNVGIVAIAMAYLIGIVYGIGAGKITGGFSSSMAMTMIGVMYLFAIVSGNGTLELLAKKITGLAGNRRYLLYVAVYAIGAILSGVGPGAIPTLAIVPVLAIPVALKAGINPILLSLIGQMGAQCVRMCPITPEAVVVAGLMTEQGLDGNTLPAMWSMWATELVMIACAFIYFKGWKFDKPLATAAGQGLEEKFSGRQILSLAGLGLMILCVVVFELNVGLISLVIGCGLILLGCADEKKVVRDLPWNTILLVLGVGVLMNIVKLSGGVDLPAESITRISSERTFSPMVCGAAGVMSFFASGLGVVFPTLIPTVGKIAAGMPGVGPAELMASVVIGGTVAGFTPISTAGALILAGVSQFPEVEETYSQTKMFVQLFVFSIICMLIGVVMAALGVYRVICG